MTAEAIGMAIGGALVLALALWSLWQRVNVRVGARAEARRGVEVLAYGTEIARVFLAASDPMRRTAFYGVANPALLREAIERAGSAAALLARAAGGDATPAQYRELGRTFVILAEYVHAIDRLPAVQPPDDDGTPQVGGSPVIHHGATFAHPTREDSDGASQL